MGESSRQHYSLIAHPSEPLVLLIASGDTGADAWALPAHDVTEAPEINDEMRRRFWLEVTTLGIIASWRIDTPEQQANDREDEDTFQRIYVLESHSLPEHLPSGARWVGLVELETLPLAMPEQRAIIADWLRGVTTGAIPALRAPWARLGWFNGATDWIREQCARPGYQITGSIVQVQERAWSYVLRVPTMAGDLYFKAVLPLFGGHEPALTRALGRIAPGQVPQALAVDLERHWLLMADATVPRLNDASPHPDIAGLEAALPAYARLQIAAANEVEALAALGCPDRRLASLPALYQAAISDTDSLLIGDARGFSEEELARLRAFAVEVPALCAELAAFGLPETLHHDDLHVGNIIQNASGYVFFDWSESFLAHPFFSLMVTLRWAKYVKNCDEATLSRLHDTYLGPWTSYAPMEELRRAFALAQRLGKLCRALTWHAFVNQLEPAIRHEYADAFPYWLYLFVWDADDRPSTSGP